MKYIDLYKKLLFIRLIEEEIANKYHEEKMRCPIHLSIGQEASALGVCAVLSKKDVVFGSHRSHAHYLAKGGDPQKMISELYGKVNGCVNGFGGSMHLQDDDVNFLASIPIVGSGIGLATGTAFKQKKDKIKNITCVFFGDGACEEGVLHESLNFSSFYNLPLLYVCENNIYSINSSIHERQFSDDFCRFAKAHDIGSLRINGNELESIMSQVKKIYNFIKKEKKPFFLQLDTYRYREHCGPNYDDRNKSEKEEYNRWVKLDPIELYFNFLKKKKLIDNNLNNFLINKISNKIKIYFEKAEFQRLPNINDIDIDSVI
jgi:TPP-dependent pyruvate/acetoin dehydrogenase alpha subunit